MAKKKKLAKAVYYASGIGNDATKICIPKSWHEGMWVSKEDREVRVRMSRGKIIIERVGK